MKFKIGDKVRASMWDLPDLNEQILTITEVHEGGNYKIMFENKDEHCSLIHDCYLTSVSDSDRYKSMNLLEKAALVFTKEPQKSFRKVGVTNGDDIPTDEGIKLVVAWILKNKMGEEFKKEIIDPILEDEKKKKKDK